MCILLVPFLECLDVNCFFFFKSFAYTSCPSIPYFIWPHVLCFVFVCLTVFFMIISFLSFVLMPDFNDVCMYFILISIYYCVLLSCLLLLPLIVRRSPEHFVLKSSETNYHY